MITVSRETFAEASDDVKALLPQHHREMALNQGTIPLSPDWPFYQRAFEIGMATIYTARRDGELLGYVIFFIVPRHPHYDHRFVKDDTIWIRPDQRGAGVATALFDFFEADLSKDGPVVIQIETRAGHEELDHLLKSREYYDTGRVYGKRFS